MWVFARWTLIIITGLYVERQLSDDRPIDDDDDWIIGHPIDPIVPSDPWDFGPWKGKKEDEWIIGGALLFIILQSKFWK